MRTLNPTHSLTYPRTSIVGQHVHSASRPPPLSSQQCIHNSSTGIPGIEVWSSTGQRDRLLCAWGDIPCNRYTSWRLPRVLWCDVI